jgi:methylated-DNA-protein-cysteine methyltransferase-like protein
MRGTADLAIRFMLRDDLIATLEIAPSDAAAAGQANETPESRGDRILSEIRAILEGFVRTYGDIDSKAPRMVGQTLATAHGKDLAWHRVVRADGTVAKGSRQLNHLRREGVPIAGNRVDLNRARLPR